ncbi:hypothetical protein [Micromonospora sp. SH-82]|uniref:hypothetical protein n=1 Tax=Micromonospora sp. SH-82 TaxID=3132938 RepID=UPI003EC132AB
MATAYAPAPQSQANVRMPAGPMARTRAEQTSVPAVTSSRAAGVPATLKALQLLLAQIAAVDEFLPADCCCAAWS